MFEFRQQKLGMFCTKTISIYAENVLAKTNQLENDFVDGKKDLQKLACIRNMFATNIPVAVIYLCFLRKCLF